MGATQCAVQTFKCIAYTALGIRSNYISSCIAKCDQFYDSFIISPSKTWNHCKTGTRTGVKQLFGHCDDFFSWIIFVHWSVFSLIPCALKTCRPKIYPGLSAETEYFAAPKAAYVIVQPLTSRTFPYWKWTNRSKCQIFILITLHGRLYVAILYVISLEHCSECGEWPDSMEFDTPDFTQLTL